MSAGKSLESVGRIWRLSMATLVASLVGMFVVACGGGGELKVVPIYIELQYRTEITDHGRVERLLEENGILPMRNDLCGLRAGDEILEQLLVWTFARSPRFAYFDIQERDLERALALGFRLATPKFFVWNPVIAACTELLEDR